MKKEWLDAGVGQQPGCAAGESGLDDAFIRDDERARKRQLSRERP
jgi:hypothetical protein